MRSRTSVMCCNSDAALSCLISSLRSKSMLLAVMVLSTDWNKPRHCSGSTMNNRYRACMSLIPVMSTGDLFRNGKLAGSFLNNNDICVPGIAM